ncbi:CatB-related O-acetyltransferase [Salinimicrobium sp. CDJ15-81-2]|nr:CatB-related O-acetyltransferase [Salinimicrobium nanhaiense]
MFRTKMSREALRFFSYIKNSSVARTTVIYPFSRVVNSSISDFSYISYGSIISNCSIGKFCSIAQNVKIGLGKHPINYISTSPAFYSLKNPLGLQWSKEQSYLENEQTIIGNDVWIGTNVTILDGVQIGNGSIVGANSVVSKDVEPYSIVGGVPAKLIRKRFSTDLISELELLKWWDFPLRFQRQKKVIKLFSKQLELEDLTVLSQYFKEFQKKEKLVSHNCP